ncbi:putative amidotransferase [hydrocarbon metagenome]|uniref:Putative amidotransferase n=1 Tax=hydrocarbon metagenome TaxID=938273 RepID=A0A0W8E2H9_9ZZZZ
MAGFVIAHMYPDLLNLYGDRGNLLCLQQRMRWYGHDCRIKNIHLGDKIDYASIDMFFMGGGSDREQGLVYRDLVRRADEFMSSIEDGMPVLCICGAYQLLGTSYIAVDGQVMEGLKYFDFITRGARNRLIGNVLIKTCIDGQEISVVGFENHGGRTYFEDDALQAFGQIIRGHGNNGEDKKEGIRYKNLIGTYLHGPLLPKNPGVADFFLKTMARRQGVELNYRLDDLIETMAHEQVKNRLLSK